MVPTRRAAVDTRAQFKLGADLAGAIIPGTMVKNESALPSQEPEAHRPELKRVLGRWDLVLLFVVAVFNLNVVPSIAANGGVTLWLWLISSGAFLLAAGHRSN